MNYIHSKTQIQKLLKLSSLIFFSLAVLSFFVQFYINSRNKSTPFNFVPSHALPIFEDKELKKHTGIIIIPNQNYLVEDIKRIIFDPRDYIPQSMIRRYTYVYQLNIMGTKYWCSENLIYYLNHEKKSVFLDFSFDPAFSFLPFIFITLGLCILILKPLITDNKPILFFLLYITLWVSSILMFFYINGFFFVYNVDYDQWFTMAQELINGNRVSRLNNTFGNTYLYMLFIILFDANTFNDIAVPFSLFNLAFVGAGTLLILTLISYKLSKSIYCAHVTAIIYILFPFLAWIFHKGIFGAPDFIGKTMLHLGTVHPFSLTLWYQSLLMSYNCMSDNIGFFFPLCSMLLVAYMRKSAFKYIVLGFILGIGICVRYTSILIWPTVFMMDYYFNPNDFKQWKKMLLIYFPLFSIFAIKK